MNLRLSSLQMDITICISVLFLIFLSDIFSQLSGQPVSSIGIFIYAGCLMIFNNKIKLISQIGFYLNWIAMNLWKPKTRYNNEIFGIFLWLMAFISFASFKTTVNKKYNKRLHNRPGYRSAFFECLCKFEFCLLS